MPRTNAPLRPARHIALGAEGETRAAEYLRAAGYRIADRNVRAGGVEIDLVAERGRLIVFVEVKTRRSARHGGGEASVDGRKRRRLVRGARAWLAASGGHARRVRFDVISWLVTQETPGAEATWRLSHYEDAFDATD